MGGRDRVEAQLERVELRVVLRGDPWEVRRHTLGGTLGRRPPDVRHERVEGLVARDAEQPPGFHNQFRGAVGIAELHRRLLGRELGDILGSGQQGSLGSESHDARRQRLPLRLLAVAPYGLGNHPAHQQGCHGYNQEDHEDRAEPVPATQGPQP